MDSNQIMHQIAKGNARSIEAFSLHYGQRLFATAYRLLGQTEAAEDALQETLIKIWKNAKKWDEKKASAYTWSYKILSNTCYDILRKNRHTQNFDDMVLVEDASALKELELIADKILIKNALEKLSKKQRTAIMLTYWEGFSNAETANIMETSVKAIETILVRARQQLRSECREGAAA